MFEFSKTFQIIFLNVSYDEHTPPRDRSRAAEEWKTSIMNPEDRTRKKAYAKSAVGRPKKVILEAQGDRGREHEAEL